MRSLILLTNRLTEKDIKLLQEEKALVICEEPISGRVAAAWPHLGARGFYGVHGIKDLQFTIMPDNVTYKIPGEVSLDGIMKLLEGDVKVSLKEVSDTPESTQSVDRDDINKKLDSISEVLTTLSNLVRDTHPKNVVQVTSDSTVIGKSDFASWVKKNE